MKRSELHRKTPLQQGKALVRKTTLRARSKKTAALYRNERSPLVAAILADRPWCELRFPGCWERATCVDEIKSRARRGSITDPANLRASCGPCNTYKEDHPLEALACGLAQHAWDTDTRPLGGAVNDPTTEVPAIRLLGGDLILTDPDSGAPVAWTVTHPDVVCGAQPTERIVLIDYVTADGTAGCHEFEASDPVTVRARSHREAA